MYQGDQDQSKKDYNGSPIYQKGNDIVPRIIVRGLTLGPSVYVNNIAHRCNESSQQNPRSKRSSFEPHHVYVSHRRIRHIFPNPKPLTD